MKDKLEQFSIFTQPLTWWIFSQELVHPMFSQDQQDMSGSKLPQLIRRFGKNKGIEM